MTQRSTTDHEEWVSQLEQLTKDRAGEYVTLEILHPAYGDEPGGAPAIHVRRVRPQGRRGDHRGRGQHAQVPSGAGPPDLTPRKKWKSTPISEL